MNKKINNSMMKFSIKKTHNYKILKSYHIMIHSNKVNKMIVSIYQFNLYDHFILFFKLMKLKPNLKIFLLNLLI